MTRPLRILSVSSEATPLVKTGGLADVCGALPAALRALGHDVRIALPCYGTIPDKNRGEQVAPCTAQLDGSPIHGAVRQAAIGETQIPLYLIEHDAYFDRPHPYGVDGAEYPDNLERFCFFSMAVLDGVFRTGWEPDVVHCHDWHTAPIPAYVKTRLIDHPVWAGKPTVFTIHNMAYQGRYSSSLMPKTGLGWELFTPRYLEFYGDINLMKAGIIFASKLNAVSPTYAKEIQTEKAGCGLEGLLRTRGADLVGISNGVDTHIWNPSTDPYLEARFAWGDLSGKRICKLALQRQLGLPVAPHPPLFGMVSRLVWDKGVDMLLSSLPAILQHDVQIAILGSGETQYEVALKDVAAKYPEKLSVTIGYNEELAHRVYAGSDFYLMPSRVEPCGLSQMYGMIYGAVPVVHRTGGLADTVIDATPSNISKGRATGFVFNTWSQEAFLRCFTRALRGYEDDDMLDKLRRVGMTHDFSWTRSAQAYVNLFHRAIASP